LRGTPLQQVDPEVATMLPVNLNAVVRFSGKWKAV
jgi:hypothetical protein